MSVVANSKKRTILKYFNINFQCNNRCRYCFSYNTEKRTAYAITLDDFVMASSIMDSVFNYRFVLNGGEPTIHTDFLEIIKCCSNLKECVLFTNGRMLTEFSQEVIHQIVTSLSQITIPIHGSQQIHDWITQVPGSFSQTISGLKRLKEYSTPSCNVEVKFIVNPYMIKEGFNIHDFLINNGFTEESITVVLAGQVHTRVAKGNGIPSPLDYEQITGEYLSSQLTTLLGKYRIKIMDIPLCALTPEVQNRILQYGDHADDVLYEYWYYDGKHPRGHLVSSYDDERTEERCRFCQHLRICRSITRTCRVLVLDLDKRKSVVFE